MTDINNLDQFKTETEGYPGMVCLLFHRPKSPPCKVMARLLENVCAKREYKFLRLSVAEQEFYPIVVKYGVGTLPRYLFIREGEVVYSSSGTEVKYYLERELDKLEV